MNQAPSAKGKMLTREQRQYILPYARMPVFGTENLPSTPEVRVRPDQSHSLLPTATYQNHVMTEYLRPSNLGPNRSTSSLALDRANPLYTKHVWCGREVAPWMAAPFTE
ncbi:hypothetical protein Hypma_011477 [Hypsizygus marmoreus]|uniref:Uncharacterized protein n=1 Tax=Hypsizygus marmoreus TaxID=39966 RepID=A0A369JR65_HYPMA|nr:hypothetical protein Hypma_011477 [Hypsizygus marmoreus]